MTWIKPSTGLIAPSISDNLAQINRDVSGYLWGNVPTREIDQTCFWLEQIKADCDFKINELKNIKADRERAQKWRNKMNAVTEDFYNEDFLQLNDEAKLDMIQNNLQCDRSKAEFIGMQIDKRVKHNKRKNRNIEIKNAHINGASVTKLAEKHELSRQQIYNILKN